MGFCAQEQNSEPILPEFQQYLIDKKLVPENSLNLKSSAAGSPFPLSV